VKVSYVVVGFGHPVQQGMGSCKQNLKMSGSDPSTSRKKTGKSRAEQLRSEASLDKGHPATLRQLEGRTVWQTE